MVKKAKKKAPSKGCPKCNAEAHVRKKKCDCGYEFAAKKPVKKVTAQTEPPLPPKPPAGHTMLPDTGDVVAQIDFRIVELENEIRRLEKARELL